MERETLKFELDTADGTKELSIKRVYNYVYDKYSDIMGRMAKYEVIASEISDLDTEIMLIVKNLRDAAFEKNITVFEKIDLRKSGIAEIKALKKEKREKTVELYEVDKTFRLAGIVSLVSEVLKDNGYVGEVLEYDYWNRQVTHGEAWRLLTAIINKDSGKKKAGSK